MPYGIPLLLCLIAGCAFSNPLAPSIPCPRCLNNGAWARGPIQPLFVSPMAPYLDGWWNRVKRYIGPLPGGPVPGAPLPGGPGIYPAGAPLPGTPVMFSAAVPVPGGPGLYPAGAPLPGGLGLPYPGAYANLQPPVAVAPPPPPPPPPPPVAVSQVTVARGMCPGGESIGRACDAKRPWPQCPPQTYCFAVNSVDIGPYYCCPVWSTYGAAWRPQTWFYPYYPPNPYPFPFPAPGAPPAPGPGAPPAPFAGAGPAPFAGPGPAPFDGPGPAPYGGPGPAPFGGPGPASYAAPGPAPYGGPGPAGYGGPGPAAYGGPGPAAYGGPGPAAYGGPGPAGYGGPGPAPFGGPNPVAPGPGAVPPAHVHGHIGWPKDRKLKKQLGEEEEYTPEEANLELENFESYMAGETSLSNEQQNNMLVEVDPTATKNVQSR